MKSAAFLAFVLAALPVAMACCKQDKITSCCGKGKCNIFCCNCDGGCKPKEQCKGQDLPICWVWQGGRICTKASRSLLPGGGSASSSVHLNELADRFAEAQPAMNEIQRRAEDESLLKDVDKDGKGYFTYEEFLAFAGYTDDNDLRAYFAKFDKNGDGFISAEEMRE